MRSLPHSRRLSKPIASRSFTAATRIRYLFVAIVTWPAVQALERTQFVSSLAGLSQQNLHEEEELSGELLGI